jgi:triosephosphate isomerase
MARKPTIIGNWKMHSSKEHVKEFFASFATLAQALNNNASTEIAICPPFVYLEQAARLCSTTPYIKLGAQDVSAHQPGAFTGQIAASMLVEMGCQYAIVGHSERRQFCQESDEEIAKKFIAAKTAGLTPVLCVGETKEQRTADLTEKVVVDQLKSVLSLGTDAFKGAILAYEPIWAIGTGLTASPEQAQQVHRLLRQTLAEYDATVANTLPILYGGSVKASNAKALFAMPDIDGALVGGASLNASDFWAICESAI